MTGTIRLVVDIASSTPDEESAQSAARIVELLLREYLHTDEPAHIKVTPIL